MEQAVWEIIWCNHQVIAEVTRQKYFKDHGDHESENAHKFRDFVNLPRLKLQLKERKTLNRTYGRHGKCTSTQNYRTDEALKKDRRREVFLNFVHKF